MDNTVLLAKTRACDGARLHMTYRDIYIFLFCLCSELQSTQSERYLVLTTSTQQGISY